MIQVTVYTTSGWVEHTVDTVAVDDEGYLCLNVNGRSVETFAAFAWSAYTVKKVEA